MKETSEAAAGKHQLRIIFDGVIAVGPPRPADGGREQDGPLFGVMAHSTRRESDLARRTGEGPKYIPMHVPTVYTTMTPVENSRPPDEVFQLSNFDPKWNIWHPIRERMEFRFDGSGRPGTLVYDDPAILGQSPGVVGRQASVHSIDRVPDAREIWPGRSFLLDGLMTAATPVRREAEAQILVPWGSVTGGGIFDKADGVEVVFSPARGGDRPRTVAPNVIVSVDVGEVEIAMFSLDGAGERLDSLKFRLDRDAELWVSNGDPSDTAIDLKNLGDGTPEPLPPDHERDRELVFDDFRRAFHETLGVPADPNDLRRFASLLYGGGGGMRPNVAANQNVRSSKFDIDFELFYTLTEGRDDGRGLPIPLKSDGLPFQGPNCLCKLVECHERLHLKSNG